MAKMTDAERCTEQVPDREVRALYHRCLHRAVEGDKCRAHSETKADAKRKAMDDLFARRDRNEALAKRNAERVSKALGIAARPYYDMSGRGLGEYRPSTIVVPLADLDRLAKELGRG